MTKVLSATIAFLMMFYLLMLYIKTRGFYHPVGMDILVFSWTAFCFGLIAYLISLLRRIHASNRS